jgi:hypothetical protein
MPWSAVASPPLIPLFADSYVSAFLLNGFVLSAVTVVTVAFRDLQRGDDDVGVGGYLRVFLASFLASLFVYALFFVVFRYGGGLMATAETTSAPVVRDGPSAISYLFRKK